MNSSRPGQKLGSLEPNVKKSDLVQAMEYYNASNYKAAIAAFEHVSVLPNANANLYLAISQKAVGKDDLALATLDKSLTTQSCKMAFFGIEL